MDLQYHPLFERWLEELAEEDEEIFGEVMGLLTALELYGRVLGDEQREESHAVVTSRFDMHALRRTPPSQAAPYADSPPVLRNSLRDLSNKRGRRSSRRLARRRQDHPRQHLVSSEPLRGRTPTRTNSASSTRT